ncbi:insulinase family protein [Candidatus Saccharibacteria bacterium]|nr:insulinase family protein [Candidatus Saccharibacteria bacterium]
MPLKHTVEEIKLNNGAKGLLIDVPGSTAVTCYFGFRAGHSYSDRSIEETSHIMEHMMIGANGTYPSQEAYYQEFTKNGASLNAHTSTINMIYDAVLPIIDYERILDLTKIAMESPLFTKEILESEKGNVREELTGKLSDYSRLLWQTVHIAMGGDWVIDQEKIETIDRVTLDDIIAHYNKTHTLKNMRFILAGDIASHRDSTISKLESWSMPSGERLPSKQYVPKMSAPIRIFKEDLKSLIFAVNIVIPRELSQSEETAMGGLCHILTGTFYSKIFGKARKMGICYAMGSSSGNDNDGTSHFRFYGRVKPDNAEALFDLIVDELKKINEISDSELSAAKQYAIGGYQLRGQTVRSLCDWYGGYYFNNETIDPIETALDRIKASSLDDINRLAKEFLETGYWCVGCIGDLSQEQIDSYSHKLSEVLKRRADQE